MKTERLEELIENCVLGQLTEDEAEELSQHLRQDEAIGSRRKLRRALKADAYLEEAAADMERGANFDDDFGSARVVPFLQRTWLTAAVAAALAIGIFGWSRNGEQSRALIDLGVASVLRIEGDGKVTWCEGNFDTYERNYRERMGDDPEEGARRSRYKSIHAG